eukprot:SAG25_NODE_991_length_4387_cov_1.733442_6_plen_176_part_00
MGTPPRGRGRIASGIASGNWLAGWITAAGTIMCAGTFNTLLCTTSQALASMGRCGLMPACVGREGRWGTPWVALTINILAVAAVVCIRCVRGLPAPTPRSVDDLSILFWAGIPLCNAAALVTKVRSATGRGRDFETIMEANMITYNLKLVVEFAAVPWLDNLFPTHQGSRQPLRD